jgi:hypothetical protein
MGIMTIQTNHGPQSNNDLRTRAEIMEQVPSRSESRQVTSYSQPLPQLSKADFQKAMSHLTALKRTADFTVEQILTWYGGLSAFPGWIVNRAIIELATSTDRFPEFGDVYNLCRRQAIQKGLIKQPYSPHSQVDQKITSSEIETIGAALGLATKP